MRVVVAEDHALLREGLTRILEANGFEVVGAVGNTVSLREVLAEVGHDLVILDVRMPPTFTNEGMVAASEIRTERPGFPLLVLSQYVEPLYAAELLSSGEGSVGYLLKGRVSDVEGFVVACRQIAAGGTVLDPEVVAAMIAARRESPLERLTDRERDVLGLMAEGRSNAAIADRLSVTEKAVAKHINNLFAKLDLPVAADGCSRCSPTSTSGLAELFSLPSRVAGGDGRCVNACVTAAIPAGSTTGSSARDGWVHPEQGPRDAIVRPFVAFRSAMRPAAKGSIPLGEVTMPDPNP